MSVGTVATQEGNLLIIHGRELGPISYSGHQKAWCEHLEVSCIKQAPLSDDGLGAGSCTHLQHLLNASDHCRLLAGIVRQALFQMTPEPTHIAYFQVLGIARGPVLAASFVQLQQRNKAAVGFAFAVGI